MGWAAPDLQDSEKSDGGSTGLPFGTPHSGTGSGIDDFGGMELAFSFPALANAGLSISTLIDNNFRNNYYTRAKVEQIISNYFNADLVNTGLTFGAHTVNVYSNLTYTTQLEIDAIKDLEIDAIESVSKTLLAAPGIL
jgi:hypothetical protein